MQYYSDLTKNLYRTEEELKIAEAKAEEKAKVEALAKAKAEEELKIQKEKRAQAAKDVEAAYKAANEALEQANAKLNAFVKEYGSFHTTISNANSGGAGLINSIFDTFFNF